jgi:hypothetical protein
MKTCRLLARAFALTMAAIAPLVPTYAIASDDDPIEGRWSGEAGFATDRVDIAFEFRRNEAGELVAYVYEPVLNVYGVAVPGTLQRDDAGRIVNKAFDLSLARVGDRLDGTMSSLAIPVTLRRTERLPAEVPIADVSTGPGPRWRVKLGAPVRGRMKPRPGAGRRGYER